MTRFAVILLSRQPIRPCATTPWVIQTIRTVRWLRENGFGLVTSTGIQTWELLTSVASLEKLPLKLIPGSDANSRGRLPAEVLSDFALDSNTTEVLPSAGENHKDRASLSTWRDALAVKAADLVIPISIRSQGTMASLLEHASADGKEIVETFRIPYSLRRERLTYSLAGECLNPELETTSSARITHWTRTTNGPWPDERRIDYYSAVMESPTYPRSAFDTLRHILRTKRIVASTKHMPAKTATVSFTGLTPKEVAPLMRWRARYSMMSFEPYGLSLAKEVGAANGIIPVIYHDRRQRVNPEAPLVSNAWQRQSIGARTDWRQEMEFRCRGDFCIEQINPGDLIIYCRTTTEADQLSREFGMRVIPFVL